MSGAVGVLDSVGMWDLAAGLPSQARAAVETAGAVDGLPSGDGVTALLALGMGGSAIAGDILVATAANRAPVPVLVHRGYDLPAWVGPDTLVCAVSCSGDTEETLAATRAAVARGARIVGVSASSGTLSRLGAEAGFPVVAVPPGGQPRAMVAALSLPLVVVAGRLGILPGAAEEVADAVGRLEAVVPALLPDADPARNRARHVAHVLDRRIPLVYGSEGPAAVAAYRWKCQINENAKAAAFWHSYPELDHNEVVGWGVNGDLTRQAIVVVELRHNLEHPQISRRFEITRELVEETVADVVEIRAEAATRLGVLYELVAVGDLVSLWLAAGEGVDPGPVEVIQRLKDSLAR